MDAEIAASNIGVRAGGAFGAIAPPEFWTQDIIRAKRDGNLRFHSGKLPESSLNCPIMKKNIKKMKPYQSETQNFPARFARTIII